MAPHPLMASLENELDRRGAPKIGGSVGGFIALVVCLCLVILISCGAIFFLLREHEPSDTDRARRRRRRHQEASKYPTSSAPWTSKVTHIFSSGKPKTSSDTFKDTRGWVQASTADEWDSESFVPRYEGGTRGIDMPYSYSEQMDSPFRPPLPTSNSASSVQFDTSIKMPSFATPRPSMQELRPANPFDDVNPPRVASPDPFTSAGSDSPPRSESETERKSSGHSFSGGTKFIESL